MDLEGENATKYGFLNYFVEALFILQRKMTNSVDKVDQYNVLSFKIRIWRFKSMNFRAYGDHIFGPRVEISGIRA